MHWGFYTVWFYTLDLFLHLVFYTLFLYMFFYIFYMVCSFYGGVEYCWAFILFYVVYF